MMGQQKLSEREGLRQLIGVLNVIKRSRMIKLGLGILIALLVFSFIEPIYADHVFGPHSNPTEVGAFQILLPPSRLHPLGTDNWGRDILCELMVGTRISLEIGFISGAVSILAAILLGLTAGYFGGKLDTALRSFTDTFLVIPSWPILAAISAIFLGKVNLVTMALILSIFTWPAAARSIRSITLSLRERPFVDLAKVTNLSSLEIIFLELMPQIAPYIIINFDYMMMGAIFAEAGLRFMGLGPPNVPSLGLVASQIIGAGFFSEPDGPLVIGSIVALFVLIFMALNFINVGIEEESNPRLKGVTGE